MSDSLLKGTVWYWRQGIKGAPIHSHMGSGDVCKTRELYLPVRGENMAKAIIAELKQNGIHTDTKKTHSTYDVVPPGSLIVYGSISQITQPQSEKENMEKLKSYIIANGGRIGENPQRFSFRNFVQGLFGRK